MLQHFGRIAAQNAWGVHPIDCAKMSREMAAPGARIRLTIEVLPLTADNVHGARRAQTLAAFKSRKFALPVQSEDTLETVWKQIEYRYKTNYLNTEQRA